MSIKPGAFIKVDDQQCCLACGQSCKSSPNVFFHSAPIRSFPSGATRDTDQGKPDFEGFLSAPALEAFAQYMNKHRVQSDGALRASDNWQKGIPVEAYMKSAWRHFFAVWKGHRGGKIEVDDLCALMFNVQGLLHERLKGDPTP